MTTFTINNLDPLFVFNKVKMISFMENICTLLSLANGPSLKPLINGDGDQHEVHNSEYTFSYKKTSDFDGLNIIFNHKGMYLLKVNNLNSTTLEFTINIKSPELEISEIKRLLLPFKKVAKSLNRPSDG